MDVVVFWYIVTFFTFKKAMFTDYSQEAEDSKTGLLCVTVKERSSSKLHNDAPTDVITGP